MRFAATRMVSSRLFKSRCCDSAMPISLSSLRRCKRLSVECINITPERLEIIVYRKARAIHESPLLDANRAYLMHIGNALQDFLHSVLFQGMHAVFKADGQQLGDTRVLLDRFFDRIGSDQQLVQAHAPAIAGTGAFLATNWRVYRELFFFIGKQLYPFFIQSLCSGSRVFFPCCGIFQLFT